VLGERHMPFGRVDYADVLVAIEASHTDHILSSMVGTDAVSFERSVFQAGLRSQARTIATLVDDTVREHIGDAAGTGLWSVLDHFVELDTPENSALTRRWRARFGPFSPPLSSTAKWVFDAIAVYAAAARAARSVEPGDVARALRAPRGRAGRALARVPGERRPACIAEAVPGGFLVRSAP
jgi:urea transport system substrate-binding protein